MKRDHRISALGSVSFGWLHAHGGFCFDESFFMDPRVRLQRERDMHAFVANAFPDDPIYNIEAHLVQIEGRRRPVVLVGAFQPNLILGAAVGAKFVFSDTSDPDITQTPLADLHNVDRLADIDWANTWPVDLFLDQVHMMIQELGQEYAVIPPFFWDTTGRATTHGIVTTAQKLIGERIFLEMTDNPAFVHELFQWIVDSYVTLINLFARAGGVTVSDLHTGECSGCMMGPEQFRQFVLPYVNQLAGRLGPLRLHSCGNSNHLLDVFGEIQNVSSLNVGSNTSVAEVRRRFGAIRIDLMPDLSLLMSGRPADVDAWVRRSLDENGEGELEFQYHWDLGYPQANCLQIHRTLESLGLGQSRVSIY